MYTLLPFFYNSLIESYFIIQQQDFLPAATKNQNLRYYYVENEY